MRDARFEEGGIVKVLPSPNLKSIEGDKPEESPLQFKFSGFAWVEQERTQKFGYDKPTSSSLRTVPNFIGEDPQASQGNTTFMTSLNFELKKDRTTLGSLFQVGEIYFGDTPTGGAQGTSRRGDIFLVRNLYLSHELNEKYGMKAGRMLINSDPRTFIFSDDIMAAQLAYKTDLSEGQLWYGSSSKSRAGAVRGKDQYFGFSGTLGFLSQMKGTAFAVYRNQTGASFAQSNGSGGFNSVTTEAHYLWAGGTFDYDALNPLGLQFTIIGNWANAKLGTEEDRLNAYLADLKLTYALGGAPITFSLEGLATSGAKDVTDSGSGNQILGRRKNFVSPIGASYLLTVASSDGADDAPGVPKQSVIAGLNQDEGLRMAVFTLNANLTNKFSGFVRYGHIRSAVGSGATGSNYLGDEADLGAVYQLTPSTSAQLDYGRFFPGAFFVRKGTAELAAAKLKFSF